MKYMIVILLSLSLSGCKSDVEIITAYEWKYGKGIHFGDWVHFNKETTDTGLYLSNDTIYKAGKPVALLENISYDIDHYELETSSLDGKRKGLYFESGDVEDE